MSRTILAAMLLGTGLTLAAPGCSIMPWGNRTVITDPNPAVPAVKLDQASGRHLIVMHVPTGGWTLNIDRAEVTPEGRRVFITARRPDPAFMHTQAFVELRALTEVPVDTHIEVVARVLDRHDRPKSDTYARVVPVESFDQ
ncbi:MAG: hypothetical protein LAT64_08880 [Phycisphaerales bacterium]|nr:hypothetical protein [Planctomycetota bacterium]MCH8508864.1 hypothetical protein [Phycisphaerales bacterium]